MKNQNRTIMGALNYSLASLQNMKSTMMDISHPHKELNWAVGGIITTLTSTLLRICHETFLDTGNTGEANAKHDVKVIQDKFNEFVNGMVNND
jgi:hypothetical protein